MSRPARLSREQYQAPQMCFVTFCTKDRRPTLVDPAVVDLLVEAMTEVFTGGVELTAYCVMPDHVHLLLGADAANTNMRATIESTKQRIGYRYAQQCGVRLWQRSYFDHTLRTEEAIESVVAYIVNNPVRAGFVNRPADWPFWGSSRWSRADLLDIISMSGAGRRPGY